MEVSWKLPPSRCQFDGNFHPSSVSLVETSTPIGGSLLETSTPNFHQTSTKLWWEFLKLCTKTDFFYVKRHEEHSTFLSKPRKNMWHSYHFPRQKFYMQMILRTLWLREFQMWLRQSGYVSSKQLTFTQDQKTIFATSDSGTTQSHDKCGSKHFALRAGCRKKCQDPLGPGQSSELVTRKLLRDTFF